MKRCAGALDCAGRGIRSCSTGPPPAERLLDLLHSAYRHERLWGIRLSAEMGKNDGVVLERLRDLAHIDQVKEVRQAAAERLAEIEGGSEE